MEFLATVIVIGFFVSPIVDIILVKKLIKEKKKYSELQVKYDDLYNSELQKIQDLLDESGKEEVINADDC